MQGSLLKHPRILFLAPSAYPLGGVADWLDYLLPGLSGLGWDCALGLVEGRHHNVEAYLNRHPWQQVVQVKNSTGSKEGRINALISSIEKTAPDIMATVNIVDAYESVRRLRLAGKPTPKMVATLHGLQSDLLADLQTEADVIDAIIATNKLSEKLAAQSLNSEERVLYAPYGVPLFDDVGTSTRQNNGVLKLLYSGRLEQNQKRVFDLPDLISALREQGVDARISIAGGGPEEAALRGKFEALGLTGQTSFLGVLKPQALACVYLEHDALIVTSVWETGPIVAWQAMSHGLPVLSSRYVGSGLEGALIDGRNSLLFPIGDIQAAASAVMKLLEPGVHARLVEGGQDLLRQRYGRKASVGQWHEAFKEVLALPLLDLPENRLPNSPSGRLDKWLGAEMGERIRRVLGLAYQHHDAGGEWPHTKHIQNDQDAFLASAMHLDGIRQ